MYCIHILTALSLVRIDKKLIIEAGCLAKSKQPAEIKEQLEMSQKRNGKSNTRKLATGLPAFTMIIVMLLMVGCRAGRDNELVGRWVWEDNPDYVTTFEADGTGTHAISWGFGTTFQWTTLRNNIRWNYPGYPNMYTPFRISGDALYITVYSPRITYRYIRD